MSPPPCARAVSSVPSESMVELWLNWGGDVQASMQGLADAMAKQLPDYNVAWLTSSGNATKLPAAIASRAPIVKLR